ncbi:alpha/beta fold hydrolase [Pigmentiphaga sp. H8]|uniref:alpha/beta fold hydrolase n=1 Tax=Pigmentiphaga sp. H8 TaxID=2488560 RepID=UPI000F5B8383|nr:alpha/beta hydrolase [Pigmentiphaga sp. H8]AZG11354.1 alpha/beta fold hydrolase [Pigmentiphaga sp. H8]
MPYSIRNGVSIHYEVSGEGPPMVLIHANPFDRRFWLYQVAHFSTWFKVVSIDIRGYGRSDKPAGEFSILDMAEDVLGVCQDLEIDQAVLMGASVGSGIALMLGLERPELFRAMVLVGGGSGGMNFDRRIHGYGDLGVARYHREHLHDLVAPQFASSRLGAYLLDRFAEVGPSLSGAAIAQIFRARAALDMSARLPSLAVPTLVVNGEFDISLEDGRRTAGLIPNAVHRILPGTGHACCIEDPAGFDEIVVAFLRARHLLA